jgi:CRISPR-associated exonuclease Cas4
MSDYVIPLENWPTGTLVNYYHICHRELWLHAHGMFMEHESELVKDGKFIHETSYEHRTDKYQEIQLGRIKIDFYDPSTNTIHETKRSKSAANAQIWQLKYYMFVMENHGFKNVNGILEIPTKRQKESVEITDKDRKYLLRIIAKINEIIALPVPPKAQRLSFCKTCSYHDFCWCE